jgi:N-acetylglucosamine malate deacetylase 2
MSPIFYFPPILLFFCVVVLWWIRTRLQDDAVPVAFDFPGDRIMCIFPHPDDEIVCAGTLKALDSQGKETILLTLTRGEAGSSNGLVDESDPIRKKQQLGEIRSRELDAVSQLLGIDSLEIFDFPDSGMVDLPPSEVKRVIEEGIDRYQPSTIITYDDRIGLYGHPDHVAIARYVLEIFESRRNQPDFPVQSLYQVTLPKPMIETAMQISDYFKQNYPTLAENGLPDPTFAVKITQFGTYKREAMLLHRSQRPTFDDMQPFFDRFPPAIYFRIFDKEYFARVT